MAVQQNKKSPSKRGMHRQTTRPPLSISVLIMQLRSSPVQVGRRGDRMPRDVAHDAGRGTRARFRHLRKFCGRLYRWPLGRQGEQTVSCTAQTIASR